MDGTLIDSVQYHWISWREALLAEGVTITHEQFLATFGQRNDSILTEWLATPSPAEIDRIANAKEEIYRQLVRNEESTLFPASPAGCASCTSEDGYRRSPQQHRVRMSRWFSRRCAPRTVSKPSFPRRTFTRENLIQRFTCSLLRDSVCRPVIASLSKMQLPVSWVLGQPE
jgi:beta-phosphoglucomutase-like phosphatase (HAD superfamily)